MEIEHAINQLQYRIDTASQIVGKGKDGKAYEDMEMAIEALEMKDKIVKVLRNTSMSDEEALDKIIQIVGIHV